MLVLLRNPLHLRVEYVSRRKPRRSERYIRHRSHRPDTSASIPSLNGDPAQVGHSQVEEDRNSRNT
jgi:hypothetical protein